MITHVFLMAVLFSLNFSLAVWNEEKHVVCTGKDFNLPVQSIVRLVVFNPSFPPGPTRVVLENNKVMDPRYEWTREKTLQMKEVTEKDQGLFKLKMSSGFIYRKIRLTVEDCIESIRLFYGNTFKIDILNGGALLDFSPKGSPPLSQPVTLWNGSVPWKSQQGRVSVKGGQWVLEGLTQADQGNYTLRDASGQLLSTVHLSVEEHSFSFTHFTGESLILPLFLPFSKTHLSFIPSHSTPLFVSITNPTAVLLVRDGDVVATAGRYKGQLTLARGGGVNEILITHLRLDNSGVYVVQDRDGNLVSSTWLEVVKKPKWKVNFKSVAASLCGFGFLTLFMFLKKKYPRWGKLLRNTQRNPNTAPVGAHVYGEVVTPAEKPAYAPSTGAEAQVDRGQADMANQILQTRRTEGERKTSITFPLNSDCLQSSEMCVQFQIETTWKTAQGEENLTALPLTTDTSEGCSVYTSDKVNFL